MNTKKDKREARNRINRLSEALFGEPDEMGLEEAEELLRSAGMETDSVSANMYRRLYKRAQQYWSAGQPLPPLLKQALNDLRPLTEPPRTDAELLTQAKARVEGMVEQARGFPFLQEREVPSFGVSAYRNKKGLTDKDKSVLEDIAGEMNQEMRRPNKGNKS